MNLNWDKKKAIEAKMVKLKEDKFKKLTHPRRVYVTFQNEKGVQTILNEKLE